MNAAESEITPQMINDLILLLPKRYIGTLAEMCYGKVSDELRWKIKYWRAGKMKDQAESLKIFVSAQELSKKYASEIAELKQKQENFFAQ